MYLFLIMLSVTGAFAAPVIDDFKIEQLVGQNPDVHVLQNRLQSSEKLKGRLTRSFLPKINLTYGKEQFTTGPYDHVVQPFGGIEAEINLFNSGKDKIEDDLRNNRAAISQMDVTILRSQVIAELKRALSHYAYLKEVKSITTEAIKNNKLNLKDANKRIKAGLATSTDLLDFRQQEIQFEQDIAALDYEMGVTLRLINTLIGKDVDNHLSFDVANAHPEHADESKINVSGKSLIVKKAELQKEAVSLELKKDKRWWTPSLDVYGYALRFTQKEREYVPKGSRNDFTLGFKISLPIFDGGEGYTGVQATKALVEAKRAEVRSQDLQIQKNTLDSLKKLELAHQLIHGAEENVDVMNKYRAGILSEYARGIKNSPDVLQASQRWVVARIRQAEVKKNYQYAKADVEFLSSLQTK